MHCIIAILRTTTVCLIMRMSSVLWLATYGSIYEGTAHLQCHHRPYGYDMCTEDLPSPAAGSLSGFARCATCLTCDVESRAPTEGRRRESAHLRALSITHLSSSPAPVTAATCPQNRERHEESRRNRTQIRLSQQWLLRTQKLRQARPRLVHASKHWMNRLVMSTRAGESVERRTMA